MARYDAADNVLEAELDNIDVVQTALEMVAYAEAASAYAPFVFSFNAPRKGILTQHGQVTWASGDLDTLVATPPDGQAYTPTSRSYECEGNVADFILGQKALADARTSNKPLVQQIRDEGARAYAKYFDSLCAAIYTEATASTHEIGSTNDALTGGLLNEGIRVLASSGALAPFFLVAQFNKYEEIMAIPGMQEASIVGQRNGGVGLGAVDARNPVIVRGWNGVLDIALTDQNVSSSGRHNIMGSYHPDTRTMVNPWTPIETPSGLSPGKLLVDLDWEAGRRAVEVNLTTQEDVVGTNGSATANDWMIDLITSA